MGVELLGAAKTPQASQPNFGTKKDFVEKAGKPKVLTAPRKSRVKRASDPSSTGLKLMFFGGWGTGKTYVIADLLKAGHTVVYITTDIGGDGTLSVKLALSQEGKAELLDNLYIIVLNGDPEVQDFLNEPAAFFPEVYDLTDVILFWDGFSGWQQMDLSAAVGEAVEEEVVDSGSKRVVGSLRAAGNKFEIQDWGAIRNATIKTIDKFTSLHNKKTGELWHKIVTCQESIKSKPSAGGSSLVEQKSPFLSGAGGVLMGGAFDLIIRTVAKTDKDGDEGDRIYLYITQGNQSNMTKVRGFKLPPVMPADMGVLWNELTTQAGITRGMRSDEVKGEILVGEGQ